MAKLALAVGEGSQLGADWASVRVSPRSGREVYRNLGGLVLLYQLVPKKGLSYLGAGRVEGVEYVSADIQSCRIADYRPFATPVDGTADEASAPGAVRYLPLDDARYEELVRELRVELGTPGMGDVGTAYSPLRPVDDFPNVRTEVLRRWEYRCAVTETQFATSDASALRVVPIRPRERGGQLVAENYLPMVELAERAWRSGAISVSDALEFVAVMDRLDADLLEAMPQNGKLVLPPAPEHAPSRESLAWHRANIFGR